MAKSKKVVSKINNELDGWLKFFLVMIVLVTIYNIYAAHTFFTLHTSDYAASAQSAVSSYINFGKFFDISFIVLSLFIILLFVKRDKLTRTIAITAFTWAIVGNGILFSLHTSAITATGGDSSQVSSSPSVLGTLIWLIYWVRSKKVKKVFTNDWFKSLFNSTDSGY